MANYHIGLDFGTSQTKVCLLNKDSDTREFVKFDKKSYFLQSLIVKKIDHTFSYGNELEHGIKYRYFKMAAVEDDELIQITNENLNGDLEKGKSFDDFRKYSSDFEIKPEILVILYLAYINLYVKNQKKSININKTRGLLGRLLGNKSSETNIFSINLGIPTEWNNPNHIKRKVKFESLLIASTELANQFNSLDVYLETKESTLLNMITKINSNHIEELNHKEEIEKASLIRDWLNNYRLSVFPESAAGVNYLLKTKRLSDGSYATLDIGAGTSDIAMFKVVDNKLISYYCSESSGIASNDIYREYAKQLYKKNIVSFEEIKNVENIIRKQENINNDFLENAKSIIKGFHSSSGIDFAIRKTFFRKYFNKLYANNKLKAHNTKNSLNQCPIIVFGGGANFKGFTTGNYYFFVGSNYSGSQDSSFLAKPITDYVNQVNLIDGDGNVQKYINLLILALGLTYAEQNDDYIPFVVTQNDTIELDNNTLHKDRYFYYDLQDAVYK